MATAERERKSQRLFWALIVFLILGYGVIKARHIAVAIAAFEHQQIIGDTKGAAK